jgi:hypothetical protein
MNKKDFILLIKESFLIIIIMGLLAVCFLIFPITEKGATAVAAVSAIIGTAALILTNRSFLLAKKSSEHTEEALKLTKDELDLAKKEFAFSIKNKRKEHIKEALEKFYIPLQQIFKSTTIGSMDKDKVFFTVWLQNRAAFNHLAIYRHLAEPEVDQLYSACVNNNDMSEIGGKLTKLIEQVDKDIIDYQTQLLET